MKIDVEEAQFQADKRKEAIEKAKTLLYYQTDRVKQFHVSKLWPSLTHTHLLCYLTPSHPHTQGALLLSEVLRERDRQVDYKQHRAEAVKKKDDHFIEFERAQREASLKADLEAAKERAKEKAIVAKYQQEQ